ncbi:plasmid recombination protein [uncultured Ruminococcus sp.]|uniref:plasmid recombination protein n=1 Tax=uncultured Ruminococcus sp. TaxID=165186 RepID=UPI0026655463|nr:plasmid recombination protein [uncultured Ruminococcus sp.]
MAKQNFSVARIETRTRATVGKFERHIERKNDSYENMNVDLSRKPMNVSFKSCGELTYNEHLDKMIAAGMVSLKGLKPDATVFDEMIMDVNTDYFEQNGGYEYACRFYEEAFHFAEKLYGKDNIVSAVMHADELNTAMTEKYGRPIYHYHLHIMALPVVDKEVRWTKRCKDPELVGKVKEVIHQVSHSKKWKSEKALDENGNPILNSKGKQVYHASYSILQDKFYEHMQEAGFNGFSRGERGSTTENLVSLEFKIKKDKEKLLNLQEKIAAETVCYNDNHNAFMTFNEIDNSGKKSFTGKYTVSADDYEKLTTLAKQSYSAVSEAKKLQEENRYLTRQIWSLQSEVSRLKTALSELTEKCRPYLEALKAAPKVVKEFIDGILERFKKQEKSIYYEPIPALKTQSQERGKHSKNKNYER